jgi:hypothetical protein
LWGNAKGEADGSGGAGGQLHTATKIREKSDYNGSGFDPEGIAETEADHFGTAQSDWDAPSRRARPPAITSAGAYIDMRN